MYVYSTENGIWNKVSKICNNFSVPADMNSDEAYALIQDCVEEVQKRLIVNLPNFQVKIVDRNGIKRLPDISIKTIV